MAQKSSPGDILHITGVRLRITGIGTLKQFINSLDDIKIVTMAEAELEAATDREKVTLVNYVNQRGQYKLMTTGFGDNFNVSKIVVFAKVIYSGYPQ